MKDAKVIAVLIRDGRYFDTYLPENEYAELRQLNTERQRIMKDVTCPTSLGFLWWYQFPGDILTEDEEVLTEAIIRESNGTEGKAMAKQLIALSESSIGVKQGLNTVRMRIRHLIEDIEHFERELEDVNVELEAEMDKLQLGEVFQSMKGIGSVISAAFLGEVGDVSRFTNWKQVRSLAGLNLVEDSSGNHKSRTRISKRGRPYLRYMLYLAGESCCRSNPEMNKYYHCLRERKRNPLNGNQALIATGLKVMRIMFHMAKTGEHYDASKALGSVRLEQIAAA